MSKITQTEIIYAYSRLQEQKDLPEHVNEFMKDAALGKLGQPVSTWVKGEYEKLYNQAKAGKRIPCYVDYDAFRDGSPKYRDICSVGHNPTRLEFSARGIEYSAYIKPGKNELKEFLAECERLNVEWLDESPASPAGDGWNHGMDEAPKDGTPIQAWHKLWNCPISVKWMGDKAGVPYCPWVSVTLDNQWPIEAFSAWKQLPTPPNTTV